jgi:DIE2/ALG10 family
VFEQSTGELRFTNFVLLYLLLVVLYVWTAVTKRTVYHEAVVQREFSIVVFPLLFFFSGLYYTDLFSAFTVVLTFASWSATSEANGAAKMTFQILHVVSGLVALGTRQTNIFWVAVYLGGLQVVDSVKKEAGFNKIHDPPVSECFFEGQSSRSALLLSD